MQPNGMGEHTAYEILKDFQPALAALVALVAAVVAWFGATSKIRFDKRLARRQHELDKLGVLIRLRHDLTVIRVLLKGLASEDGIDEALASENRSPERKRDFEHSKRMIDQAPEIESAWKRLEFFPIEVADEIGRYRRGLLAVSLALDPTVYPVFPSADTTTKFSEIAENMFANTEGLIAAIDALIEDASQKFKALG